MTKLLEDGYEVFHDVVPRPLINAVVADLIDFVKDEDPHNLAYRSGLVEMYHFQSMWNVRQHPAVYDIFRRFLETRKLWVSIDRVCFKPPVRIGGFMHWDENPHQNPRPMLLQGLVALNDQTPDMGGFHCLPSLYRELDEFLESRPMRKAPSPNFELVNDRAHIRGTSVSWPVVRVPLRAGDLLVWHSFLPHGNGANCGDVPRMCQYVTMFPEGDERLALERVRCWQQNETPSGWAFPGDPRRIEQKRDKPAELTDLSRKLLGQQRWE